MWDHQSHLPASESEVCKNVGLRGGHRAPQRGAESDVCPDVGSIHAARVERIAPFGVFVHLPGFRKGLVHSSQVRCCTATLQDFESKIFASM